MNKEEFESLGFKDAYLDESINEGGNRREQIEHADFEIIKNLRECGGTKAVDAFIDASWSAWYCAESLIGAVDSLFHLTNHGRYNKQYDELVGKMIGVVVEDMRLALVNAETHILYDDDPTNEAENYIESFAYGLAEDLLKVQCSVQTARSEA